MSPLRSELLYPEEMLAEGVDTLLSCEDVAGVPFFTRTGPDRRYVAGFDQQADCLLADLDSDGTTVLLVILALRERKYTHAYELASRFFKPLEDLAADAIKARPQEDC